MVFFNSTIVVMSLKPNNHFYLLSYDISCHNTRSRICKILQSYSYQWQKSVYECYLTPANCQNIKNQIIPQLNKKTDRFLIIKLPKNNPLITCGIALKPAENNMIYIG
ncbi:MAG: CRISPR-associated endonuclease Cas2 [Gammaproteobacteria bacterium]|nr:MAG: CRISPR-associated endonuclease Cas2 [Gammaproteobacteria bacterium]